MKNQQKGSIAFILLAIIAIGIGVGSSYFYNKNKEVELENQNQINTETKSENETSTDTVSTVSTNTLPVPKKTSITVNKKVTTTAVVDSSSSDSVAMAEVSGTAIHKKIVSNGWVPNSFFKLDLGGKPGEEIFGSYRIKLDENFEKTTFVVFEKQTSGWKEIAFTDFLGIVNVFIRSENGVKSLVASVKISDHNRETFIKLEPLSEKDPYGFYYELETGF